MPAYAIVDIEVTDPKGFEEYRSRSKATIDKFGGRFVVRGGAVEVKEGAWQPHRLVVVQFSDMDSARRWYDSDDYQSISKYRAHSAKTDLVLVEGVPD